MFVFGFIFLGAHVLCLCRRFVHRKVFDMVRSVRLESWVLILSSAFFFVVCYIRGFFYVARLLNRKDKATFLLIYINNLTVQKTPTNLW